MTTPEDDVVNPAALFLELTLHASYLLRDAERVEFENGRAFQKDLVRDADRLYGMREMVRVLGFDLPTDVAVAVSEALHRVTFLTEWKA